MVLGRRIYSRSNCSTSASNFLASGCIQGNPLSICNLKKIRIFRGVETGKIDVVTEESLQVLLQPEPLVRDCRGFVGKKLHEEIQVTTTCIEVRTGRGPKKFQPPDVVPLAD